MSEPLEKLKGLLANWRKEGNQYADGSEIIADAFASEVESLLPELEAVFANQNDVGNTMKGALELIHAREAEIVKLEAEIAALKEPMACSHPKACWVERKEVTVDELFAWIEANPPTLNKIEECPRDCPCRLPESHCTACERENLAVAAALVREGIVAPSSPEVLDALDVLLAEERERVLAAIRNEFYGEIDNGDTEGWYCKDYMTAVERVLRGSK